MNLGKLRTELRDDPTLVGYAQMTDAEAVAALNARTLRRSTRVSVLGIAAELGKPVADRLLASLAAAGAADPTVAHVLKLLENGGDVDVGHDTTRGLLDAFAANEALALAADDAAAIKGLADNQQTRGERIGAGLVRIRDVVKARGN